MLKPMVKFLTAIYKPLYDFAIPYPGSYDTAQETKAQVCKASVTISSTRARVWRALTDPTEVPNWDSNLTHPLNVPENYLSLRPDQIATWKYWIGPIPFVLYDFPKGIVEEQIFGGVDYVGPIRFYDKYEVSDAPGGLLHVEMTVGVWSTIPWIGSFFDKNILKPGTQKTIERSLRNLKLWCEQSP